MQILLTGEEHQSVREALGQGVQNSTIVVWIDQQTVKVIQESIQFVLMSEIDSLKILKMKNLFCRI